MGDKKNDKPLISFVLLLRKARRLDEPAVRRAAAKAFQCQFDPDDPQAQDFVVGKPPTFMIQHQGNLFLVHNFNRPYVDDPEAAAREAANRRDQQVLREHRAWLSVDFLAPDDKPDLKKVYPMLGRMAAELADADCLAVFCPATGRLTPDNGAVQDLLRSPDPLKALTDAVPAPIIDIEGDDPDLKAAVAEARRRWPEFVAAFRRRKAGEAFVVKAPFSDGSATEFMWMMVSRIEGSTVHGVLGNQPLEVKGLKERDVVTVVSKDVADWIYREGDSLQGNFTQPVIDKKAKAPGGKE